MAKAEKCLLLLCLLAGSNFACTPAKRDLLATGTYLAASIINLFSFWTCKLGAGSRSSLCRRFAQNARLAAAAVAIVTAATLDALVRFSHKFSPALAWYRC